MQRANVESRGLDPQIQELIDANASLIKKAQENDEKGEPMKRSTRTPISKSIIPIKSSILDSAAGRRLRPPDAPSSVVFE